MNGFTQTTVFCHEDADHTLEVKVSSVRRHWQKLDETGKKIRAGNIRAYCRKDGCPEHDRFHFVGLEKIPALAEIIDDC